MSLYYMQAPCVLRPSVGVKLLLPEADSFHISHTPSIGRGNESCIVFLFKSDKNSDWIGMASYKFHRL